MKFKPMKLAAMTIVVTSSIAGGLNYLWLIGLLARPNDEMFVARWIYAAAGYCLAFFLLMASSDFEK